ncbi:hypothetical protein GCM10027072_09490 [Streptomyces bullii]
MVLDWSKYCDRLESVDEDARTCVMQPGIVLDELNRRLAPTGLRFGPEPATHANCAIGGMIGNNACGATAQAHGKAVDNMSRLEVLLYDGTQPRAPVPRPQDGRPGPSRWPARVSRRRPPRPV